MKKVTYSKLIKNARKINLLKDLSFKMSSYISELNDNDLCQFALDLTEFTIEIDYQIHLLREKGDRMLDIYFEEQEKKINP